MTDVMKISRDALEQARLYIEGDEETHGRQFGDGNAVRSALAKIDAALSTLPVNDRHHSAWIVGNGRGTEWRYWTDFGPAWTPDREKATRYARREDAEAVHAADEDAWTVEPYVSSAGFPRNSESDRQTSDDVGILREALEPFAHFGFSAEDGTDILDAAIRERVTDHFAESEFLRARAALKGAPQPANWPIGYLYLNPDTGTEFSENHPVESGECDDAENILEATAEALRDALLEAWREREEAETDSAKSNANVFGISNALREIEHLTKNALARLSQPASEAGKLSTDEVTS
ncbi:hypothetical protein Hden_3001 [Hyphomicrobium denitrificans ATCC 51888]|uniref:Uncharacterized protein n=1 Tax=Hyphomicrobium denitrificans (strain ATCC 51888 / DSM 1869 / NCIMB 11706 / TK 0415) TaxID=582899 RepID=D8JVE2_HYPDA|nr:hypothetical protein [Hyphomicrobium denitrificans]ADJ24796.1 hypothetical protein Hden_3001 [Hyphomicrobium denitrificans ATCC 51888]